MKSIQPADELILLNQSPAIHDVHCRTNAYGQKCDGNNITASVTLKFTSNGNDEPVRQLRGRCPGWMKQVVKNTDWPPQYPIGNSRRRILSFSSVITRT